MKNMWREDQSNERTGIKMWRNKRVIKLYVNRNEITYIDSFIKDLVPSNVSFDYGSLGDSNLVVKFSPVSSN